MRVAVAPFAGESAESGIASELSVRLAQRPIERVIAPDAFRVVAEFEPRAAVVRQWAYNVSVDTIVVGRVFALDDGSNKDSAEGRLQVETVLRSGHSGAEMGRQKVVVMNRSDIEGAADRLAAAILGDLGYHAATGVDAAPHRDPRSPEPLVVGATQSGPEAESEEGFSSGFELGTLRENVPIEINADEAEIVDRGAHRKLVFQRNVRVRQGNVRLESDQLEAEYRKGEPEPDRLIAQGSVQVDQGYRHAKCDRAIYMREEQTLSCEGRAELVQGCDIVRGDSIQFDLAGDEAHVIGAASVVIRPNDDQMRDCGAAAIAPDTTRELEAGEGAL